MRELEDVQKVVRSLSKWPGQHPLLMSNLRSVDRRIGKILESMSDVGKTDMPKKAKSKMPKKAAQDLPNKSESNIEQKVVA